MLELGIFVLTFGDQNSLRQFLYYGVSWTCAVTDTGSQWN